VERQLLLFFSPYVWAVFMAKEVRNPVTNRDRTELEVAPAQADFHLAQRGIEISTIWDLTDLGISKVSNEMRLIGRDLKHFSQAMSGLAEQSALGNQPGLQASLERVLQILNQITERVEPLRRLGKLPLDVDLSNRALESKKTRIDRFIADVKKELKRFEVWFAELPPELAAELLKNSSEPYFLSRIRGRRIQSRGVEAEIVLRERTEIEDSRTAYKKILNTSHVRVDGEDFSGSQLLRRMSDADRTVREPADRGFRALLERHAEELLSMYTRMVRHYHFEQVERRGFGSILEGSCFVHDISPKALVALSESVARHSALYQPFLKAQRERILAEEGQAVSLVTSDYSALIDPPDKEIKLREVLDFTIQALSEISPQFAQAALEIIQRKHLHLHPGENKRAGAYTSFPGRRSLPYILGKFEGFFVDANAFFHEIGHAVSGVLAMRQSPLAYESSAFMDEVFSMFLEQFLTQAWITKHHAGDDVRKEKLFQLQRLFLAVPRQIMNVNFELEAHAAILSPVGLDLDGVRKIGEKQLRFTYGSDLQIGSSDGLRVLGTQTPFIHPPLNSASYAWGALIATRLVADFRTEPKGTGRMLEELFAVGGSRSPAEALRLAGISPENLEERAFWDNCHLPIRALSEGL